MDLGFVDPTMHHALNSVYEKDGKYPIPYVEGTQSVRGNFGGMVQSTHVLQWARDTIEVSFTQSSLGYTYYNCSDGAYIKGAVPLLPEFVDLPEPDEVKEAILEQLVSAFPVYSADVFQNHWQDGKIIRNVREIGDRLIACIQENPCLDTKKYITQLMNIARPIAFDDAAVLILRGSLSLLLVVGEHYLDRIEQPEKREYLTAFVREEYCRIINSMCDEVAVEISSLEKTGTLVNRETVWA